MFAAAALLTLHFVLAVGSKRRESTTSDELVHLTAGFSYWQFNDYRLHPENGNLPQRWAALPAWLAGAKFPPLAGNDYWRVSDAWVVGHQFFYETGEDHFPRLMAGRAMIALFSVATGVLVFCWSRRLFGTAGAFVSLGFFTFCPTFLAHGALVTSDVCMAFFFLAALGAWWWHLHDGRTRIAGLSAFVFGLAFVAKYSAVLLPPILAVIGLTRALAPQPLRLFGRGFTSRSGKLGAIALSGLGHALVAVVVIWAFYGFRYSAFSPATPAALQFIRPWETHEASLGETGRLIHAVRMVHLLPEAYLYGFAYVLETVKTRAAFLNGSYSVTGWPMFFPWAFVLKTPVPLLLAGVLTVFVMARRWLAGAGHRLLPDLYRVTPLVALFVVYWLTSFTSHLNIGHRHLLPTYPVLFIATGVLASRWTTRTRAATVIVAALLGCQAVSAFRTYPHFIAYFNALAGGPENGRHHLVDSSLDWGQDLPGLKTWLDQNAGREPVYLSYFGTGEPAYYDLHVRRLAFLNGFQFPSFPVKLEPGVYCISATILMQVYGPTRGTWTAEAESEYQRLRLQLEQGDPGTHPQQLIQRHDQLRLARLCQYLRVRPADASIGHSILIYRLNAREIAAGNGSLAEWAALMENPAPARR